MRVVLDTNILLSALMVRGTPPDRLYEEWRHGRFQLASTERQIDELRQVVRRPFFVARLKASEVGRMINDIRRLAVMCNTLPAVSRSSDPNDDNLLALCQAADADYCRPIVDDLLQLRSAGQLMPLGSPLPGE